MLLGNKLIFAQGEIQELPAEASVPGSQVMGLGWVDKKLYVFLGVPTSGNVVVKAYELSVEETNYDVSGINDLHKVKFCNEYEVVLLEMQSLTL